MAGRKARSVLGHGGRSRKDPRGVKALTSKAVVVLGRLYNDDTVTISVDIPDPRSGEHEARIPIGDEPVGDSRPAIAAADRLLDLVAGHGADSQEVEDHGQAFVSAVVEVLQKRGRIRSPGRRRHRGCPACFGASWRRDGPMDGRCATCRHPDPGDLEDPDAWDDCRPSATDAIGEPVESVSLATAQAIAHTGARLATAPTSGCVQWAAREDG